MILGRRRQRQRKRDVHATAFDSSVDLAWRTHNAQEAWTQKVDVKASVLLALEGGAIFAALTANSGTGLLARATGPIRLLELIGVVALVFAVGVAVWALLPQLGSSREHKATHQHHTIYFGHLRHWDADQLAERLRVAGHDDPFPMLARQLVEMSTRNWFKHRTIQLSLVLGSAGFTLITLAAVLTSMH